MKGKRYSPEQIVKILREGEGVGSIAEVARRYGVSEQTIYRWKKVYAGMEVSDLKRFKGLQAENAQLKKLVAYQALKISTAQRICGVAKKTVERLLVAAGKACAAFHDKTMRNLAQYRKVPCLHQET